MNRMLCDLWSLIVLLGILVFWGCRSPEDVGRLDGAISAQEIRAHLKILSDDSMAGRAPGSPGEELAARYIAAQFQEAGLEPAVGDSSYFQTVNLVGIKSTSFIQVRGFGGFWQLSPGREFVASTRIEQKLVSMRNKDVIFVGYGVDAPEFGWNDYEDIDVTGKILLGLVNEPPSRDESFFAGPALTYYGRWIYKFEEAARHGADGLILIHTTESTGHDWDVVQNSVSDERFHIPAQDNVYLLPLRAWINEDKARSILAAGGLQLDSLIAQARSSAFAPIDLSLRVAFTIRNEIRELETQNVLAVVPGDDFDLKKQCVVLTSHYDHLGDSGPGPEDTIYNGAIDNASGTATLLAMARALALSPIRPKRSVLFIAVTAKESGLLGSQYYVENPVWPLALSVANINVDAVNVLGATKDMLAIGAERSSIIDVVEQVAYEMNVRISPDPVPERGAFFLSDQFSFARLGIPAIYLNSGHQYYGQEPAWGLQDRQDYTKNRYHTVNDEFDPQWSLAGTVQLARFALKTTLSLANSSGSPVWRNRPMSAPAQAATAPR